MRKNLVIFGIMAIMFIAGQSSFANCPCQQTEPQPACPCQTCEPTCPCQPCCEGWLNPQKVEEYFCRIGFSDCQKEEARNLIEQFKCDTKGLSGGVCASKCDCRKYRKELRNLDYNMRKLLTQCQKSNYKTVRCEVKSQVKCCHKCLIWPSRAPKCCKCK